MYTYNTVRFAAYVGFRIVFKAWLTMKVTKALKIGQDRTRSGISKGNVELG